MAVFLLVVAAVTLWTLMQTPVYRATAVVQIQSKAQRLAPGQDVSGLGGVGIGWFAEEKYHNTQVEIIKSRDTASRVLRNLGLREHPRFKNLQDPVNTFRTMLQVAPRRETGLIEISMDGPDPNEIAQWVNETADAYVERNIEKARENVDLAVQTIRSQIEPLQNDVEKAEMGRFDVLRQTEIFNPENQQEIIRDKLSKYNDELSEAQIEVAKLKAQLEKIRDLQESGASPLTLPELAKDPVLVELNSQKVRLERELEGAKVTLRPGHPDYEKKVSELNTVENRIRDQVALILSNLDNQYTLAVRNEAYLSSQLRKAEKASFEVGQATSAYEIAKTNAETKKRIYDLITKTMNEVQLSAQLLTNNVSVLDHAVPPHHPIRPRKRMNLAMGAFIGLLLGIASVFFLDYLDNTLRTPEEIEKALQVSVLATVPRVREGGVDARAVKESYQSLRTSVIFSSKGRERKLVLVTSAGPQEGKSSTVASLARALASAGDRVMVLDCDLRRPTQHEHFGVSREGGMTNYLAAGGETDWREFVKTVGPEKVDIITCGPIPPNPVELFGAERFHALLADLRSEYDWILLDSPPAAPLADASVLAAEVEMVVLVVRHNETNREMAARVVQQIRNINPAVAGVVLNDVDLQRTYKGEYYYAGYYYADDSKKKRGKRGKKSGRTRESDTKSEVGA